jgi:hypothetical protein
MYIVRMDIFSDDDDDDFDGVINVYDFMNYWHDCYYHHYSYKHDQY